MITRKNLLLSAFIGLPLEVVRCSQRENQGLKGIVVDATKNMITIELEGGKEMRLQKAACVFRFTCEDGQKEDVVGADICFRPHERPKKV